MGNGAEAAAVAMGTGVCAGEGGGAPVRQSAAATPIDAMAKVVRTITVRR